MRYFVHFFCMLTLVSLHAKSQRNCGTANYIENAISAYPELERFLLKSYPEKGKNVFFDQLLNDVIIIPVVVHVIYKKEEENISEDQINAQINSLNIDFQAKNRDYNYVPTAFQPVRSGDCKIRFVLQSIIRKQTTQDSFYCNISKPFMYSMEREPIKFAAKGGSDAATCDKTLNIWIGNITDKSNEQLLAYASPPNSPCNFDGIVMYYRAFGFKNCIPKFDKGRTLTHEAGHFLGLKHIWGDAMCGEDSVKDTPPQETYNKKKPTFRKVSVRCNNGPNGDMFMNYMDYVWDEAMYMFTQGQKERMRSYFSNKTTRAPILYNSKNKNKFEGFFKEDFVSLLPEIESIKERHSENFFSNLEIKLTNNKKIKEYEIVITDIKDNVVQRFQTKSDVFKIHGLIPGKLYTIKLESSDDSQKKVDLMPILYVVSGSDKKERLHLE